MSKSKYENIQTATELVKEVMAHGMSVAQDDIIRMQDIFGNSTIEELDRLANDIGRNNEAGEPDPEGSWSSGRPATQSTFYMIAFAIWNWEDATLFWNLHSNYERKRLTKLNKELTDKVRAEVAEHQETKHQLQAAEEKADRMDKMAVDACRRITEMEGKNGDLQRENEELTRQITELKAKLYDMITAVA